MFDMFAEIQSVILAAILGGIIGYERSKVHKPAGMRTHMLVALGSALFTVLSTKFFGDPARIASGIVSGVGFIGAGTIIAERRESKAVVGITTAASLWATSAIGMAAGMGEYALATVTTILVFAILELRRLEK
jgi:putative Mg2+ transporter-C (MgtC) family protein